MEVRSRIDACLEDLTAWRRHLHANPELGFEERQTAAFIAEKLREFGLEVRQGLATTGVVGVLRRGNGPMIGLRADMDALPISEATGLPYASKNAGRMHACGHDGHSTMLLGAARLLAESPPESGGVVFIFQPAEETLGGGKVMVEDGLFDAFPVASVFGLHNWPGVPKGQFAVHKGPVMAACDLFEVSVDGRASHAAMPHQGIDPISISGHLLSAWQEIVSRNLDPAEAAAISVTQIHAGDAWNVIPESATMRGTVRTLRPETRDFVETRFKERTDLICRAFGARARIDYQRRYPATINSAAEADRAAAAAAAASGQAVLTELAPSMAAEDFSFMLEQKPGAYVWLGGGSAENGRNLHSPHYDFDDDLLPIGVEYWFRLAHRELGSPG